VLEAVQLWVNLPARDKRSAPLRDIREQTISRRRRMAGRVSRDRRRVARRARALGLRSRAHTLHWTLEPGAGSCTTGWDGGDGLPYYGGWGFGADGMRGGADSLVLFDGERGPVMMEAPVSRKR
jgi:redox-sensitive bicupin YhaK (pirin superfamily)